MNVTIINDCRDANAAGRQLARASTLFSAPTNFVGVQSDIEAAGNIIDILDANGSGPGVLLVNVAPRNGAAKKWFNGTPFGYFTFEHTLVVASIDGHTLSLVKKLGLADTVKVLDIATVVPHLVATGSITAVTGTYIIETQFRSFDFVPRIAAHIHTHGDVPHTTHAISDVTDLPPSVWWVDNFGNCKTTLLDHERTDATEYHTTFGSLPYYTHLKDVPDGTIALITGSSGIGEQRFLEIVMQGGSAADELNIASGAALFL